MREEQPYLFDLEDLQEDVTMQSNTLEKAWQKAYKDLSSIKEHKRIPFGIAFLGEDKFFGLAVLVVKWHGDMHKFMGSEERVLDRWENL